MAEGENANLAVDALSEPQARAELARLERVGQVEAFVGEGLERLHRRQRLDLARQALLGLANEGLKVVQLRAAAAQHGNRDG